MGLFNSGDIVASKADNKIANGCSYISNEVFTAIGNKLHELKPLIEKLDKKQVLHFCSEGRFSSHELLLFLLQMNPGFDVYIATWKVSEDPARMLVNAKKQGLIKDLYLLLERRMQINSPSALELIRQNSTMHALTDIHAKVFVIDNPLLPITVVTSANMSDNRRIEVGVIDTHLEAACFHKEWIKRNIELCQK
jgi:phosphatidylserine/phosphatidylglycerophosphate/cardiolipin synthase-like enzyme